MDITQWVRGPESGVATLPLGYFGSSTGAAAALIAAAERPRRGRGRGLARRAPGPRGQPPLRTCSAPTLLLVGGADREVLKLNIEADGMLGAIEHTLEVIPGATHLFEEPGALEAVADFTARWFERHFTAEVGAGQDAQR